MIGYSTSAKRWKVPFGAGRETTSGFVRAAVVRSRGARASTDRSRAASRATGRILRACTATFRLVARRGFAAFAQRCLVPSVSLSARRCFSVWPGAALCAGTAAADTATARTTPSVSPAVAKVPRRRVRRKVVRVMTLSPSCGCGRCRSSHIGSAIATGTWATASISISTSGRNSPATWTSELVGGEAVFTNSSRTARIVASSDTSTTKIVSLTTSGQPCTGGPERPTDVRERRPRLLLPAFGQRSRRARSAPGQRSTRGGRKGG